MTQKDYIVIARVISNLLEDGETHDPDWYLGIEAVTINLTYHLKSDNPRFNRAKFLQACGVKGY